MNYRNFADLNETILKRLHIIPRDIDLVEIGRAHV